MTTTEAIERLDLFRSALDDLVSAVQDGKRRHMAGDSGAIQSSMIRITLTQAENLLIETLPV